MRSSSPMPRSASASRRRRRWAGGSRASTSWMSSRRASTRAPVCGGSCWRAARRGGRSRVASPPADAPSARTRTIERRRAAGAVSARGPLCVLCTRHRSRAPPARGREDATERLAWLEEMQQFAEDARRARADASFESYWLGWLSTRKILGDRWRGAHCTRRPALDRGSRHRLGERSRQPRTPRKRSTRYSSAPPRRARRPRDGGCRIERARGRSAGEVTEDHADEHTRPLDHGLPAADRGVANNSFLVAHVSLTLSAKRRSSARTS